MAERTQGANLRVNLPERNASHLDVPELLRRYGLRPDKSLGQNFLIDPAALEQVIQAAEIEPQHCVLEIGPGLGSLTRLLAGKARQVVAVELDANLIAPLQEVLSTYDNVKVIQGDILAFDPAELMDEPGYLVAANIPYYITSALMRHLLEASRTPQRLALTVQREVAERICASPGEMSLLSISVQVYGNPRIMGRIPAGAFYPSPQVDSSIVRIDLYPTPVVPFSLLGSFFRLAKAGFSQKRKTLRNALMGGMRWPSDYTLSALQACSIDPQRRAETLSLEEWRRLVEQVEVSPPDQQ
ncbi:MAG: ribosomal RNA small subunit methyltransferase A [Anaerolineales bacterium]|nr:ribosomal RNA small subunit methyltransferase A [Anaerolineales bacterium]